MANLIQSISVDLYISFSGLLILWYLYVYYPIKFKYKNHPDKKGANQLLQFILKHRWWMAIFGVILVVFGLLGYFEIID